MGRTKQIDIKRALALAGTFSFLCSCAKSSLLPFLTLYFRQLGLSPAMTGIVMGTRHFITLLWRPSASLLAKHYNKRRIIINCSLVFSAVTALLLLLVPPIDVSSAETGTCNTSLTSAGPSQSSGDELVMAGTAPPSSSSLSTTTHPKTLHVSSVTFTDTSSAHVTTKPSSFNHNDTEDSSDVLISKLPKPKMNGSSVYSTISSSVTSERQRRSEVSSERQRSSMVSSERQRRSEVSSERQRRSEVSSERQRSSMVSSERQRSSEVSSERQRRSEVSSERQRRSEFVSLQPEGNKRGSFEFLGSLKEMDIHSQLFLMILFIVSVWECASAPLDWTADDGLYEYLDFADASDRYSSSEVWGLLGAACGVGGTGLLVSQLDCVIAGHTSRRAVHFYCYAVLAALTLPAAAYLPLHLNKKRDRAGGLLKAAQLVHGSPRALLCTFTLLLVGMVASAVDDFLLWQMQDHGSSELHMGLTLSLALLSQAAFPFLAGRVSKFLSPGRVLVLGAASLGLQCFYYSFLWGAWAALPAQVLSCFSSGALWWAVTIQCEDVATPGAERSVRRIYNTLCLQLGSGLGSFAGGFVVQRFGLVWLYRGAAVGLMVWCVCLPLLQWKAPHQRRINYSRLLAADASEASDSESEQERDWLDKAMEDDGGKSSNGRRISA